MSSSTDTAQAGEGNPSITPGTVLAGKYRVEKIIGQGGMGLVVEARHLALDERVALKFLLPEYATHPEASQRFLREARAAVKIKSAHVARVSDVGQLETGAPYMVMEFLEGADVSKLLETKGVLQVPDAVDFTIQACEAIAEAHSYGIVHRDLKPANMFVTRHTDGAPLVKVLDFGISKVQGPGGVDSLTRTTAAMGSALYMSPEQMQSTRSVDHRTDIYALGVALYEMLAGKQPYYADTLPQLCAEILTGTPTPLRAIRPDLPEHLAWTIEKAYARDRAQRYQSVAEFVISLAPYAPPRSQPTIDRVARMAGLSPPVAGAAPTNVPSAPGGTQVLVPGGAPADRVSDPMIIPGHYTPPASTNARAHFAGGSSINVTGATTDYSASGSPRPASKAGLVVGISFGAVVAIAGVVFVLFFRGKDEAPSPAQPPDAPTAPPVVETAAAPPPTAEPKPSADPAPSATPVAASAEPSATPSAPLGRPRPGLPVAPQPRKTAAPAAPPPAAPTPQPTTPKRDVFNDR